MFGIIPELVRRRGWLLLMRALPGCGKSYEATHYQEMYGGVICSADHYWGSTPEEYKANFKFEKLFIAHRVCQDKARKLMEEGEFPVIIDNTNIKYDEMFIYCAMALEHGYSVCVAEPCSPWWQKIRVWLMDKERYKEELENAVLDLVNRNQHGVPPETFRKMINGWNPEAPTFDHFCRWLLLRG